MQFYVLGQSPLFTEGTYATHAYSLAPHITGDAQRCPNCGLFVSNLQWLPPHHAEVLAYGRAFGDVAFPAGNSLLVSTQFRQAWLDAHLVGLDVFSPIERIRVRPVRLKKSVPTYYHIAPKLFDVRIDIMHSLVEYDELTKCTKCMGGDVESVRGFALDLSTWHGEDIFRAWGISGEFIVSDRVRELRDKHGLTNVHLIPTENYFWDPHRRWTPVDHSPDDPDEELIPPDSSSTN